ncbi:cyclic pyranopterin monophosphate synthase MoaC [Rhodococcus sp. NPDC059968]|uniref:cyclic pyranopterin monophosphate synthase MoaC n=1 Tax=Rhodococcus sp. NPDC059968 TaxID=3347017 RepID=UPI00366B5224
MVTPGDTSRLARDNVSGVNSQSSPALPHLDRTGAAHMVDISEKDGSTRVAVAEAVFNTTEPVIALLADGNLPKGDALATARLAGVMAAKRTADLIPLCHTVQLTGVSVQLVPATSSVTVTATARCVGRTGVEMEALTAVAVASLALHDMVKAVDPCATITDVRLVSKTGGKRGDWDRTGEHETERT